jgi:aminoglycoside phosphotransferase (APT) family kinase protein
LDAEVDVQHRELIAHCLDALGANSGQVLHYDVLGGVSGAYTYRLRCPSRDLVLKVALPESPAHVLERASRELLFYRDLRHCIQLRVPTVIAMRSDATLGACILLDAYTPSPPPTAWPAARYIELATHLGRFHATFWGRVNDLASYRWLRKAVEVAQADVQQAFIYWERLSAEKRFERVMTRSCSRWIREMLSHIDAVEATIAAFPLTLCHGDFHVENILEARDGELVVADWQEVGLGRGPEDLSFFLQRASFSSGTVPAEDVISAYQQSLAIETGDALLLADIRRVIDAAEFRTRLLHWPAYLTGASADQMTDMLERIRTIAAALAS